MLFLKGPAGFPPIAIPKCVCPKTGYAKFQSFWKSCWRTFPHGLPIRITIYGTPRCSAKADGHPCSSHSPNVSHIWTIIQMFHSETSKNTMIHMSYHSTGIYILKHTTKHAFNIIQNIQNKNLKHAKNILQNIQNNMLKHTKTMIFRLVLPCFSPRIPRFPHHAARHPVARADGIDGHLVSIFSLKFR